MEKCSNMHEKSVDKNAIEFGGALAWRVESFATPNTLLKN